jgi:hypothetical protein
LRKTRRRGSARKVFGVKRLARKISRRGEAGLTTF